MDFRKYYALESYLFDTVTSRFKTQGYLDAFDFFCIVIWKAQRAKSRIAKKLQAFENDLDRAAFILTRTIAQQPNAKERLRTLMDLHFPLPTSSAILTVLYPKEFTVYDKRVCNELGDFHKLTNLINFEAIWEGYQEFRRKVEESAPGDLTLRDKDRYLWGKSFYKQLRDDIQQEFKNT